MDTSQAEAANRTARVARQPIFDADRNVAAYELLYRSSDENSAAIVDGDAATGDVLLNAFVNVGLEQLVGDKPAFINLTRRFFEDDRLLPAAADKIVLEVLEDIVADEQLVQRVISLSERGFTIALDDFVMHGGLTSLLPVADIVKVELPAVPPDQLASHVDQLRQFPVRLLAEKVETHEQFEHCRALGFELFQGFFLARPETIEARKVQNNYLSTLRILAKLSDPQVDMGDLEETITADAVMVYKFLRFVNSTSLGVRREVSSVQHALALLGLSGVRNVVALVVLSEVGNDKPTELVSMALVRAHMAMQIADAAGYENPPAYFMSGLVSLLDAILDQSLQSILQQLPLEPDVVAGIAAREGRIGKVLNCVEAYERADFDNARLAAVDDQVICDAFWSACATARALSGGGA